MGTLVPVRSLLPAYLTSYKAVVPHGKVRTSAPHITVFFPPQEMTGKMSSH